MKLTTSHKAYVGIMLLALAAFAVDRLLLSSGDTRLPSRAEASGQTADRDRPAPDRQAARAASPLHPPVAATPSTAPKPPELAWAGPFEADSIRDAFMPSDSWHPKRSAQRARRDAGLSGAEFAKRHKLTSTMVVGAGGTITVDGRILRIGQEMDGFRLTHVNSRSAVFRSGTDTAELTLDESGKP